MAKKPQTRVLEAQYRQLVEQVPAVTYIAERGRQGRWHYVSPQIERILGFSPEEWMADRQLWRKQVHLDDLARALAQEQTLKKENDHYRVEYRMRARDGREVWVRDEATYIREPESGRLMMRGLLLDISERKLAEDELRRSQQHLQSTVSAAPVVLFALDRSGIFTLSEGRGLQDLGLKPGQAVGQSVFELYRENPEVLEHARRALAGEEFECIDSVPQLQKQYVTWWRQARDSTGKSAGVIGVATDITEQRKAEAALRESQERYRVFVSQSSEGISRTEYDPPIPIHLPVPEQIALSAKAGYIAECNDALARMYGCQSAEELIGRRLAQIFSPEDPVNRRFVEEFIGNQYRIADFETRHAAADGQARIFRTTMVGIVNDGHLARTWSVQRDVTERLQLEQQVRSMQQMEAIGRLAGGVAHDFNNMMGIILGHVELLSMGASSAERTQQGLAQIRKAADQAASLTQQLLAFSRRQVLQPRVLDLNQVVSEVQSVLARVIGEDIELITKLHPSLAGVKADPGQMRQVLMNLAVNARDAMPHGGRLTMETANRERDGSASPLLSGRCVILRVSDTGHGMDAQTLEHIFEPFFTTKQPGKGTGLGLATVYGIVKQSGGDIRVFSEPGKGSSFELCFPAEVAPEAEPEDESAEDVAGGNETVLLVEDEPELREIAGIFLRGYGYRVLEAGSAAEALDLVKNTEKPIDVTLTDVIMPGASGRQLAEQILTLRPEMKVIYMTGYTDDMVVHHKVLEPGVALLQKPLHPGATGQESALRAGWTGIDCQQGYS